jgi:division protein CdvB (Snf7/Vps24/ESCRT-III family)
MLDREISSLKVQEDKSRKMLQQMAKKRPQDVGSARLLAKELVRARKQRQRMYQSKATLNSIQMQLQEQIGMFSISTRLIYSDIQDQWDFETEYRGHEGCQLSCQTP